MRSCTHKGRWETETNTRTLYTNNPGKCWRMNYSDFGHLFSNDFVKNLLMVDSIVPNFLFLCFNYEL